VVVLRDCLFHRHTFYFIFRCVATSVYEDREVLLNRARFLAAPLPASVGRPTRPPKDDLTRQTISLLLDTNRPDFSDTQADPKGFKNFPTAHFKK
jgi:hypothetical protein